MVIGVSGVRLKRRSAELGIGEDEVLGEPIEPKHSAVNTDWNRRKVRVDSTRLAVVERPQCSGERDVVAVGEAVTYRTARGAPRVLGSGLQCAIGRSEEGR